MTTKTEHYGPFAVEAENQSGHRSTDYYVRPNDTDGEAYCGSGNEGKKRARTLAGMLKAAEQDNLSTLPPGWAWDNKLSTDSDAGDVETWAVEESPIPAEIAAGGKPVIAAYLYVVYNESPPLMNLGVSKSTIRQYLSNLRAGRR